ncbi:phage putative head morphogenesis protein, SPP1 gp7 family [Aneurinibacillus thermoaerophilus]|uniref:Phage putative head morphogenesis protein, SPP1 gp7 family n=1 Tax=Aneurinibacillus thermoaerophilus TaxID=143495 RepID=A0A1G8EK58_ANETH|nr:minor capsid protein [Aneurinibacillus thermoaerophilus]SDH70333.1 phage putative head morphogenesis protein, SPP1 gp7 family [Aneurinibacillus thermoaerophilus]
MGLLERISSFWRRGSPNEAIQTETQVPENQTPITHSSEMVDETYYLYKMMQVENDRRAVLRDVENMLESDPLIDETNSRIARKAVRGGIFITVTGSGKHQKRIATKTGKKPGRGSDLANRAQGIIDRFSTRCKIDANAVLWISRMISDGDLFLNIMVERVADEVRIGSIRWVPAMIMKRNEDQFGQFIDINRAFSEIDPQKGMYYATVIPDNAVRHFPLWAINHIRWKYRGGLYGNSQYKAIRKLSRQNGTADDDMVVRRKTRAPLRRVHSIGSKDNPGDPKVVEKYKQEHKDLIINGKYVPTTDYYHNGMGDVKNLEGDGNLDKIADVKYLYDKQNTGTIIPKGLVGHAEDINRDVLDDQKEEYYDTIEDIRHLLEYGDGGPFSGLRAIIDFELLLHGIDVEATGLTYDITFQPLRTESPSDVIDRTIKAREAGVLDHRTSVINIAHIFNVEDPELILQALEDEKQASGASKSKGNEIADSLFNGKSGGYRAFVDADEEGEEDPPHLKGMDKIEKKTLKIWQQRFAREEEAVMQIEISLSSVMLDAEDGEKQEVYLTEEEIAAFLEAVTEVQQQDQETYAAELSYVYVASGEIGGQLAAATVGIKFGLFKEDILEDLLTHSSKRIVNIDETTREAIREALGKGYLSGSKKELIKLIHEALGEVYANAYHNRAEMIARTESMWAYNRAADRIYDEVEDLEEFEVLVTKDERTCKKCKKFIGQTYTKETAPELPAHPRCRCVKVPKFKDQK